MILAGALADELVLVDEVRNLSRGADLVGLNLVFLGCAPLLYRRRRPVLSLAVSLFAVTSLALLGYQFTVVAISLVVLLATIAYRSRSLWVAASTGLLIVTAFVLGTISGLGDDTVALLITSGFALAVGGASRFVSFFAHTGSDREKLVSRDVAVQYEHDERSDRVRVKWWQYTPPIPPPWPPTARGTTTLIAGMAVVIVIANIANWVLVVKAPEATFAEQFCPVASAFDELVTYTIVKGHVPPDVLGSPAELRSFQSSTFRSRVRAMGDMSLQMRAIGNGYKEGSPAKMVAFETSNVMDETSAKFGVLLADWEKLPVESFDQYVRDLERLTSRYPPPTFDFSEIVSRYADPPTGRLFVALKVNSQCAPIRGNLRR